MYLFFSSLFKTHYMCQSSIDTLLVSTNSSLYQKPYDINVIKNPLRHLKPYSIYSFLNWMSWTFKCFAASTAFIDVSLSHSRVQPQITTSYLNIILFTDCHRESFNTCFMKHIKSQPFENALEDKCLLYYVFFVFFPK